MSNENKTIHDFELNLICDFFSKMERQGGGLLQIATSVCNMLFPKIKGTVTALVMIASSLCNYTILTAASKMQPSGVMTMNIVLTAVGVALGLFVNIRYKKMVELAQQDN